jgi:hypothetical protein
MNADTLSKVVMPSPKGWALQPEERHRTPPLAGYP